MTDISTRHWTHYLTVLHYTSGEKTGYQVIGTYTGNDGLWYNGCSYSGEEKYYLHDFYVDYAGLDLPKMFIPDLLNDTGRRTATAAPTSVEAPAHFGRRQLLLLCADHRLGVQSGDGVLVLPLRHRLVFQRQRSSSSSLDDAKAEWESTGANGREDRRGLALRDARGHEQHDRHAL